MSITHIYSFTEPMNAEHVLRLYQQTNWAKQRDPLHIQHMLDNSQLTLGVWDEEKLIGFARVVTDDVYRAWIDDIVVDAAYRNQGIGSTIVKKLLKRLEHIELIMLDCAPELAPFYEKHQFKIKTGASMRLMR